MHNMDVFHKIAIVIIIQISYLYNNIIKVYNIRMNV